MTNDIRIRENWDAGRYDGDTADVVAELSVDSVAVEYREPDARPTVTLGLSYAEADAIATQLAEAPAGMPTVDSTEQATNHTSGDETDQ